MADKFMQWLKYEIQNTTYKLERLKKFGDDQIRLAETDNRLDVLNEVLNQYSQHSAVDYKEVDLRRNMEAACGDPFPMLLTAGRLLLDRRKMALEFSQNNLMDRDRVAALQMLEYVNENIKKAFAL